MAVVAAEETEAEAEGGVLSASSGRGGEVEDGASSSGQLPSSCDVFEDVLAAAWNRKDPVVVKGGVAEGEGGGVERARGAAVGAEKEAAVAEGEDEVPSVSSERGKESGNRESSPRKLSSSFDVLPALTSWGRNVAAEVGGGGVEGACVATVAAEEEAVAEGRSDVSSVSSERGAGVEGASSIGELSSSFDVLEALSNWGRNVAAEGEGGSVEGARALAVPVEEEAAVEGEGEVLSVSSEKILSVSSEREGVVEDGASSPGELSSSFDLLEALLNWEDPVAAEGEGLGGARAGAVETEEVVRGSADEVLAADVSVGSSNIGVVSSGAGGDGGGGDTSANGGGGDGGVIDQGLWELLCSASTSSDEDERKHASEGDEAVGSPGVYGSGSATSGLGEGGAASREIKDCESERGRGERNGLGFAAGLDSAADESFEDSVQRRDFNKVEPALSPLFGLSGESPAADATTSDANVAAQAAALDADGNVADQRGPGTGVSESLNYSFSHVEDSKLSDRGGGAPESTMEDRDAVADSVECDESYRTIEGDGGADGDGEGHEGDGVEGAGGIAADDVASSQAPSCLSGAGEGESRPCVAKGRSSVIDTTHCGKGVENVSIFPPEPDTAAAAATAATADGKGAAAAPSDAMAGVETGGSGASVDDAADDDSEKLSKQVSGVSVGDEITEGLMVTMLRGELPTPPPSPGKPGSTGEYYNGGGGATAPAKDEATSAAATDRRGGGSGDGDGSDAEAQGSAGSPSAGHLAAQRDGIWRRVESLDFNGVDEGELSSPSEGSAGFLGLGRPGHGGAAGSSTRRGASGGASGAGSRGASASWAEIREGFAKHADTGGVEGGRRTSLGWEELTPDASADDDEDEDELEEEGVGGRVGVVGEVGKEEEGEGKEEGKGSVRVELEGARTEAKKDSDGWDNAAVTETYRIDGAITVRDGDGLDEGGSRPGSGVAAAAAAGAGDETEVNTWLCLGMWEQGGSRLLTS